MLKRKKEYSKKEFKRLKKYSLQELYVKDSQRVEEVLDTTHAAIIALLEQDWAHFEELANKVKDIEEDSDDIHDFIVERLFGKETLQFTREDRLFLANEIDDIVDRAQDVVINAQAYQPRSFPNSFVIYIMGVVGNLKVVGSLIKDAIHSIFTDFNMTFPIVKSIEELKSETHTSYNEFYKKLFEADIKAKDLLYFDRLVTSIWHTIFTVNKFADGIRRLIYKYRL